MERIAERLFPLKEEVNADAVEREIAASAYWNSFILISLELNYVFLLEEDLRTFC